MTLAEATAVRRIDDRIYAAEVHPGWDIVGNTNGGYLLAIAGRAAAAAAGRPDPVSITAHFLTPAGPGPVTVETEVVREGRRFSAVRATMRCGDRPILAALGSFAELTESGSTERVEAAPPDLPPPEDCVKVEPTDTFPPPFVGRVDLRLHPEHAAFDDIGGVPRVRGWFRLLDGEAPSATALLVAADAFPPTVFFADLPTAWVPTLEQTTHVRARPAPGWLRCAFTTRFITGGFLEEDGEVWDSEGRLVAQTRQLALLPRDRG